MPLNESLYYTADHEWIEFDGTSATIGITDYAADQLGDIVYVELPDIGSAFDAAGTIAEIESTKSVGEVLAPVNGEIVDINQNVIDNPELVNQDPFGAGWLLRLRFDGTIPGMLLNVTAYETLVADAKDAE